LDSKGRVSNIKGTDEMVDAMVKDAGLPEAVSAELKKQYGQKKIEELFSIMHMFPDKPVAKGDKWDITKKMRDGATDFTQTYTLKDIKDKMAIIAFTGTLKMATTASGPAGQTVTMKQMNDVSGTSQVNIDTGMVKQMDMTLKGSGTSGNESTFTFDMKVALTIEKGTYKAPTTTKAAQ